MSYTLLLSEEAENDINLAFLWYEEQKAGLGTEFLDEVGHSLSAIQSDPLYFGYRWHTVRGLKMKRFPYIILYVADAATVRVMSVFHSHKRPLF